MIGEKVVHPKYGHGVVRKTRHRGFELQVEFENKLTLWIRQDELIVSTSSVPFKVGDRVKHPYFGEGIVISIEPYIYNNENTFKVSVHFRDIGFKTLIGSIARLEKVEREKRKVKSYEEDPKFKSRRMIEAFRLGIVPYDCVEKFTFGRDKEQKQLNEWLDDPNENTMLIIGEYGTGKTHLLHYAIGRALRNNFAVAWVEMDPNEAPFHKPKRVYNHLIKHFKYHDDQTGQLKRFRDFLKYVLAQGAFRDHIYFQYLIEHDDEIFWEWIEGSESIPRPEEWIQNYWNYKVNKYQFLPGLYDYSTAANIYCYLLSGLGWAASKVLGLKGLLLIFDEAETVEMYYYSYQSERSKNFLKSLIRTAKGEPILLGLPSQSGLDYCDIGAGSITPFLYKKPSGLKLLFAFTNLDWNYRIVEIDKVPKIYLPPLSTTSLKNVFKSICHLYNRAYDFLEKDMAIDDIFHRVATEAGRTRLFVKGSVEALDLARLNKR